MKQSNCVPLNLEAVSSKDLYVDALEENPPRGEALSRSISYSESSAPNPEIRYLNFVNK